MNKKNLLSYFKSRSEYYFNKALKSFILNDFKQNSEVAKYIDFMQKYDNLLLDYSK